MTNQNPLLQKWNTPFETVPFDKIKNEHYLPALEEAIKVAREEIVEIKTNTEKETFNNVIAALDSKGSLIEKVSSVFYNLHSAETNDEMQSIAKEFSPMLTAYSNDVTMDPVLFEKIKVVYDQKGSLNLDPEEATLLENKYSGFVRNGALLKGADRDRFKEIETELSKLRLDFGDHVLKETNAFELLLEAEDDLIGLPEFAIEAAAAAAKEKGREGWMITLDFPSFGPFMKYSERRELREELIKAYASRANHNDSSDNKETLKSIAVLRHERAVLLGYSSHSAFVLEERMAEKPEKVMAFLDDLLDRSFSIAKKEIDDLQTYAEAKGFKDTLQVWDYAFYARLLKKEKFEIDDEILKPYFKLENVIDGVFTVANKLYGLNFKPRTDIAVYHPDVKTYEVQDNEGRHVAIFYADFFPRAGKRNGAWMTCFREQHQGENGDVRPHVMNVCNFSKPTESKPSLLNFGEVQTLFHEFGHGLHGMLSKCKFHGTSGTNVYWDFVELPSQILENWAYEKECLDLFAKHFESGESIPAELIEKIKSSATFHEGRNTVRQLSLGFLDMSWHSADPSSITDVEKHEKEIMKKTELHPAMEGDSISCSFSHIFQGGYSSGYYSYKWAEVLDADAFEFFKEKGIFNKEVADKFRENVLERGGSEHPMILYKRFRGKEPSPEALLKRGGLI
ncbi:MAG: M3 family metallopeptidase [Halobacteriovoraceae bacterium]|jgi:Zn-dependent oligopeptidase|nr:M3 family metallopeptidase [Halobacteriovoraceae bacterium]MBT5093016.1 M3 family metallopeptidase [Halobacteriovoraceae bacterium]